MVGLACAVIANLTTNINLGLLVWLLGVGAWALSRSSKSIWMRSNWFGSLAVITSIALMVYSRVDHLNDVWLGLSVALCIPFLISFSLPFLALRKVVELFSDFSYTLYLVHFSIAAFIWYSLFNGERLGPSLISAVRFGAVFVFLIIFSYLC